MLLKVHFLTHNTLKHNIKIAVCMCIVNSVPTVVWWRSFSRFVLFIFTRTSNKINILYLYWRIFLVWCIEKLKNQITSTHASTEKWTTECVWLLEATCGVTLPGIYCWRGQLLSNSHPIKQSKIRPYASVYIVNIQWRCGYWYIFNNV